MSATRTRALLLATLMVASTAIILPAPDAEAQSQGVPVGFESAISEANLHFYRDGNATQGDCDVNQTADQAGNTPPFCAMRIRPLDTTASSDPDAERRTVRGDVTGTAGTSPEQTTLRFPLDTDGRGGEVPAGAEFPFTIRAGSNAITYSFYYDSEVACSEAITGEPNGQPIEFHMQLRRGPAEDPLGDTSRVLSQTKAVELACGTPGGDIESGNANQVVGSVSLNDPISVAAGETLTVELFGVDPGGNGGFDYSVFFEDDSFDSKLVLRTTGAGDAVAAVEQAVWATDKGGDQRNTFNPDASADERFMVGRMALRSPFGPAAVPAKGFTGEIEGPDNKLVDLRPDRDGRQNVVDLEAISGLTSNDGARKVYQFPTEDDGDRIWHYGEDEQTGPYKVKMTGRVLGQRINPVVPVAMGAFDFNIEPVNGETTNHDLLRDSSTTFLLEIENGAPDRDTFELSANFEFAQGSSPWSVELAGVDQNDRVTLEPGGEAGDSALVQVKITPPSDATVGDAARVNLTARSLASDSTETIKLQGTISDQVVRRVGLVVIHDGPFKVGVDETRDIRIFAWNQGTARDSIRMSFVEGSFTDPEKLNASFSQQRFDNIAPGSVASVPITLSTTDQVSRNESLSFQVRGSSVNDPSETSNPLEIETVIEATRSFDLFALDGKNTQSIQSTQYGMVNQTDIGTVQHSCESRSNTDRAHDINCKDYMNWTYHRFTLENTGSLTERFALTLPNGAQDFRDSDDDDDPATGCDRILPGRIDTSQNALVDEIDPVDPSQETEISEIELEPGATEEFYLRVNVNGSDPFWQSLGASGSACDWEAFDASVRVDLVGSQLTKIIETTTKVFVDTHPESSGFDRAAQARVAVLDRPVVNGTVLAVPDITGVEPGTGEPIHFSVSQQAGHYDPTRVKLGPADLVEDLREDGWRIEIVSPEVQVTALEDAPGVRIPDVGSRTGGDEIVHTTGYVVPLRLMVRAPTTGVQEDVRHTLSITAESSFKPSIEDTLSAGIQIGKDFAFDLDAGSQSLEATPGDTVGFGLTIQNTGASRDTFDVSATISPETLNSPQVRPGEVSVSSGSQKAIAIEVPLPDSASPGQQATVSVQVTGQAGDTDDETLVGPQTQEYTIDIRDEGTLSMEPVDRTVRVGPGGQNNINFTISNAQNSQRTVRLVEQNAPPGWETTLSGSNDTVTVPPEGDATFQYLIEAPDDIVEGSVFTFVVRAEDVQDPSDFAVGLGHATTLGETAVRLDAEQTRVVVDRGGNATIPVLVRNPGTSPTWYELSSSFASTGWSARILDGGGNAIANETVRVAEKQFQRVLVDVQAPEQVDKGHVEDVQLTATAVGQQDVTDTIRLDAAIHDFAVDINVTGALTKDAVPADDVAYTVSITNAGNGPDRISLDFEGPANEDTIWPASSELSDDTTPVLRPGETIQDVTIEVHAPSPAEGPVPVADGVTTVIRATSSGELPTGGSPTATSEVTTRLVKYVRFDVDGDNAFEMAVDLNRDSSDGFEVFADRDETLIERDELARGEAVSSEGLHAFDGDDDDRIEHLVDSDGDGVGDRYFDPGRKRAYTIPYTFDADDDAQPEHPLDTNFDGSIEAVYDPGDDAVRKAVNLDFSGDGRADLLIDKNSDTFFDTFVDPHQSPPTVTSVDRDDGLYKLDTDGNGEVDTHYDVETQSITDARVGNFETFLGDYWWFLLVFLLVVVLFGAVVYRRL